MVASFSGRPVFDHLQYGKTEGGQGRRIGREGGQGGRPGREDREGGRIGRPGREDREAREGG